jgi:hypothetical protein
VTLYGESLRLQTMPSKSIVTICSNNKRPSARGSRITQLLVAATGRAAEISGTANDP